MAEKILVVHTQTLASLSKINSSIGFLQEVMENLDVQVNEKLRWLNYTLSSKTCMFLLSFFSLQVFGLSSIFLL
jgi:hypothetical protein